MTPHLTSALAAALAGALAAGSYGCNAVDCGTGTIESNGTCVPADIDPDPAQCGDGTKLGPGGTCIPEREVMCDPGTTVEHIDTTTGVVTCVGVGTPTDCSVDLPCSAPENGKITICGRLRDTQTDAPIQLSGAQGMACDPANPSADGPCSIKMTVVDAVEFQGNPTGAQAHIPGAFTLDDCGRYRADNLMPSSFGFTGIAIDDANGAPDRFKLTGVALDDNAAKPARAFSGYVTANATDTTWSTAITAPSFATRGVLMMVFRHAGVPVAGVMARRNQAVSAADDYYFTDASPTMRTMVSSTQNSTGTNGTALMINQSSVDPHDGIGSEPAGCRWPSALSATIPTVVFVQIKDAETTGGAACP
jgi:hypothetical protein